MFRSLQERFRQTAFGEGDILVLEPRPFGGAVRVLSYRPGLGKAWYAGAIDLTEAVSDAGSQE